MWLARLGWNPKQQELNWVSASMVLVVLCPDCFFTEWKNSLVPNCLLASFPKRKYVSQGEPSLDPRPFWPCEEVVSQARPTSAREGRIWWTAYTSLVPAHCTVRPNHVAVFCHMMHYIIVSVAIAVLKTVKGSQDIFPATTRTVKTLQE